MIKRVLYFVLSIMAIIYILSLSAEVIFPGLQNMGLFGEVLYYFNLYGGVTIVFAFALVNFTGNIFKIVLNVLLILAVILYIVITFVPDYFAGIFNFI